MKSLIKNLSHKPFAILLRNTLNFKPIDTLPSQNNGFTSISDAFIWRTDNGFKTKFKYADLLKLFYNIEKSWIEIVIFSKKNEFIKKLKFNNLQLSNEFIIDKNALEGIEDYGSFFIYHYTYEDLPSGNILSNRCYLGYSHYNKLYSFVHGNTLASYTCTNTGNKINTNIVKTSLLKNQNYRIQKNFKNYDSNEIFFANPTSKTLRIDINNKYKFKLCEGHTKKINISDEIIDIKSNCLFLRPLVFSFNGEYMDVHHS